MSGKHPGKMGFPIFAYSTGQPSFEKILTVAWPPRLIQKIFNRNQLRAKIRPITAGFSFLDFGMGDLGGEPFQQV